MKAESTLRFRSHFVAAQHNDNSHSTRSGGACAMFRWSTKPETNHADHQWVVSTFRKRRAAIENASSAEQLGFQLTLAIFWQGFLGQHGRPDRFPLVPRGIL